MFKKILYSALLAFVPLASLQGAITWGAFFTKEDKKVIILGDLHAIEEMQKNADLVTLDSAHTEIIKSWFIQLSHGKSPIIAMLEASKADGDKIDTTLLKSQKFIPLINFFAPFAKIHNYKIDNLAFVYSDIRTKKMYEPLQFLITIPSFLETFSQVNSTMPASKILALYKDYFIGQQGDTITCTQLFDTFAHFLDSYRKSDDPTRFGSLLQKAENEMGRGKKLLGAQFNAPNPIIEVLFQEICPNNSILQEKISTHLVWLNTVESYLSSCGFIQEMHALLKEHNFLVFLGGHAHAVDLTHSLEAQGFTCCKKVGTSESPFDGEKVDNTKIPCPVSSTELASFLQATDSPFSFKKCALCNTASANHCSRCKKVSYCSVTCQKQNWQEHKKVCQPNP
jgi:hypothetical protein